jgi:hypothetical protein
MFTPDDINTGNSSLRVEALSNDSGTFLVNISEPSKTSAIKSPMQRFLENHNGPNGVQHIALESSDIFATVRAMSAANSGFGFMPHPGQEYYRCAPFRDRKFWSSMFMVKNSEVSMRVSLYLSHKGRPEWCVALQGCFVTPLSSAVKICCESKVLDCAELWSRIGDALHPEEYPGGREARNCRSKWG